MAGLKSLLKDTAIYGISSVVARLLNYLLVPYYTRIMSPAEYGVITDIYALIPFALVVLTLGMESGLFRFSAKAEQEGGDECHEGEMSLHRCIMIYVSYITDKS